MEDSGVITVVSAGNEGEDACSHSPACHTGVITVGSYDIDHHRAWDSNWGRCVDAWGPGEDILSSVTASPTRYKQESGTSMASPIIAGIVGYFLNIKPDIEFDAVIEYLADHITERYSYSISDCRSLQCRAFSMHCADLGFIATGTERPTATPRPTVKPTGPSPSPTASPTAGPSPPTMPGTDCDLIRFPSFNHFARRSMAHRICRVILRGNVARCHLRQ